MKNDYKYFDGKHLFGDDFSKEEIEQWYSTEAEAYADMSGVKNINSTFYRRHRLNRLYGFRHLKKQATFHNVLGLGSSWGYEFLPIIDRIENLTIVESSQQTRSTKLGKNVTPRYQTPTPDGKLNFPDDTFDLITCFSTLHHIPNVSFVLQELFRVLQPGGHLLLTEPINSMGDWRKKREGLTANERGLPKDYLQGIIDRHKMKVVSRRYYYCMTSFLIRTFPKLNTSAWWYLYLDMLLSRLFTFNIRYHRTGKFQNIAPSNVYYVLKKLG